MIFDPPNHPLSIHFAIYLPTAGRETEFVEAISDLDVCISELTEKYPSATMFLIGDFNVSHSNRTRTGILDFLCSKQSFQSLNIPHATYHHFMGMGSSDSHLDRIFYSESELSLPLGKLVDIHCKLSHPLIDSHHDIIVSSARLPLQLTPARPSSSNILAPRVENVRTRINWTETGIVDYQALVSPQLQLIQATWLSSPSPSRSIMSLSLQSTNRVLVEAACSTNKSCNLGKPSAPKPSPLSRKVRKSQGLLLKSHRKLSNFSGSDRVLINLKEKFKNEKSNHRRLLRAENSSESFQRDCKLFSILEQNPSRVFSVIRSSKRNNSRKISKLSVGGKSYCGESVPDGFFDSLTDLKTLNLDKIQDPTSFSRHEDDYHNILKLCSSGSVIPMISLEAATGILKRIRPNVNDFESVTANHFLNAGEAGLLHFYILLEDPNSRYQSCSN